MEIQGITQAPTQVSETDDNNCPVILGKQAELIVAELHGKYYTNAYRGNIFWATSDTQGGGIPASSDTSIGFSLWNPAGSQTNAVIIKYIAGLAGSFIGSSGNIQFAFTTKNGSVATTGSSIPSFTSGLISGNITRNGLIGGGAASKMKFAPSGATISAAGTLLGTVGMSQLSINTASTSAPMWQLQIDFDGALIVPPGGLIYPVSSVSGGFSVTQTLLWKEIPL